MDGCNWLPLQSSGSTACRHVPSSASSQIYTLFEMEEEHEHFVPAPSSTSSFCCFSGGSPDDTSSAMVVAPARTINTSYHRPAEASSSPQIALSPVVYGDLDTIASLEELMVQEAQPEQARHGGDGAGDAGGSAFRPYVRHLGPRKKPKASGASEGQRAIKRAISILGRMHVARLARMKEIAAAPVVAKSNVVNQQQQHVLSERKRREKLNNGFKALKAVLPPAPKKDKASILIRARDYINTLKSRVAELEEKTSRRMLVESPYHCYSGISREAGEGTQELHVKILVRSGCNAMDAVVSTLQCLKEIRDVRLVGMEIGSSSGLPYGNDFPQTAIASQLKEQKYLS
ncbi:hypothetical protein ACP4OV_016341 [Aristida adscensionis]